MKRREAAAVMVATSQRMAFHQLALKSIYENLFCSLANVHLCVARMPARMEKFSNWTKSRIFWSLPRCGPVHKVASIEAKQKNNLKLKANTSVHTCARINIYTYVLAAPNILHGFIITSFIMNVPLLLDEWDNKSHAHSTHTMVKPQWTFCGTINMHLLDIVIRL